MQLKKYNEISDFFKYKFVTKCQNVAVYVFISKSDSCETT